MYIVTYYNGVKPKVKKYKTRTGAMRNFNLFFDIACKGAKYKLHRRKNEQIEVQVHEADRLIKQVIIYIK